MRTSTVGSWRSLLLTVSVLFFSFFLVSFSIFAQSAPEDVAKALIAAEGANDVDATVALFADDAVVTLPTGVLDTADAIRGWQQEIADGNFRLEAVNMQVDGNTVTWEGSVSLDRFRDIGIASIPSTWSLVIEDGKIQTFDFNFTPEGFVELGTAGTAAALIAGESAHDVDSVVALFADDAVVTLPTGVLDTPEAIRGWQQELADGNFRIEPEGRTVSGTNISWTGDISLDRFRDLGIASLSSTWSLVIEDGKVQTFDFTFTPDAFVELGAGATAAAMIGAESANDVDAAMANFADDAVVTLPTGVLDTPELIRGWQQELADGHFRIEPEGVHVDGNTVSWTGEISLDRFRELGIATLGGNWTLVIENGKIETFDFSFTPEAMSALGLS